MKIKNQGKAKKIKIDRTNGIMNKGGVFCLKKKESIRS